MDLTKDSLTIKSGRIYIILHCLKQIIAIVHCKEIR